jgi:hypothetical protein
VARAPKTQPLLVAGNTGLRESGGQLLEEYARALRGTKGVETYQEMADSPLPGAFLLLVDLLARQVDWIVEPAIAGDAESERWAEFLRGCMDDLETDWRQIVGELLTCVPFGWARSEVIYKIRRGRGSDDSNPPELRSDFNDGLYGWRDFSPRSQDSLDRWEFDADGKVVAMFQRVSGGASGSYRVPEDKMIAVIPRPHKRSPEGRSMFRPGSRSWFYARRLEDSEALGIDRDLTGVVVQEVPARIMASDASAAEASTRSSWEDKIRKLRRGQLDGLLVPAEEERGQKTGYRTRLMASGGTGRIVPDGAIRRHESRLLISLLSEFMLLGVDGVGARAVADPKINLVNLAIGALLDVVADAINARAVYGLMRLNAVPTPSWPKIAHTAVDAPDLGELVTMLGGLVGSGLVVPTDAIQRWVLSQIPNAPAELHAAEDSTTVTAPDGGVGVAPSEPAANTALNGAQVASAQEIVASVGRGELSRDSGVAMLIEFFNLDPQAAARIMGPADPPKASQV